MNQYFLEDNTEMKMLILYKIKKPYQLKINFNINNKIIMSKSKMKVIKYFNFENKEFYKKDFEVNNNICYNKFGEIHLFDNDDDAINFLDSEVLKILLNN